MVQCSVDRCTNEIFILLTEAEKVMEAHAVMEAQYNQSYLPRLRERDLDGDRGLRLDL